MTSEDVKESLDRAHTIAIVKTIGRFVVASVAVISVASYACERSADDATAKKPPCNTYVCSDK
jgi:hypothetical protein